MEFQLPEITTLRREELDPQFAFTIAAPSDPAA